MKWFGDTDTEQCKRYDDMKLNDSAKVGKIRVAKDKRI